MEPTSFLSPQSASNGSFLQSDSEDELFFGPTIGPKEAKIMEKLRGRKTELFQPGFFDAARKQVTSTDDSVGVAGNNNNISDLDMPILTTGPPSIVISTPPKDATSPKQRSLFSPSPPINRSLDDLRSEENDENTQLMPVALNHVDSFNVTTAQRYQGKINADQGQVEDEEQEEAETMEGISYLAEEADCDGTIEETTIIELSGDGRGETCEGQESSGPTNAEMERMVSQLLEEETSENDEPVREIASFQQDKKHRRRSMHQTKAVAEEINKLVAWKVAKDGTIPKKSRLSTSRCTEKVEGLHKTAEALLRPVEANPETMTEDELSLLTNYCTLKNSQIKRDGRSPDDPVEKAPQRLKWAETLEECVLIDKSSSTLPETPSATASGTFSKQSARRTKQAIVARQPKGSPGKKGTPTGGRPTSPTIIPARTRPGFGKPASLLKSILRKNHLAQTRSGIILSGSDTSSDSDEELTCELPSLQAENDAERLKEQEEILFRSPTKKSISLPSKRQHAPKSFPILQRSLTEHSIYSRSVSAQSDSGFTCDLQLSSDITDFRSDEEQEEEHQFKPPSSIDLGHAFRDKPSFSIDDDLNSPLPLSRASNGSAPLVFGLTIGQGNNNSTIISSSSARGRRMPKRKRLLSSSDEEGNGNGPAVTVERLDTTVDGELAALMEAAIPPSGEERGSSNGSARAEGSEGGCRLKMRPLRKKSRGRSGETHRLREEESAMIF